MFYWLKRSKVFGFFGAVLAVSSFFFFSCESNSATSKLFNIDSLVTQQINFLSLRKPTLSKVAVLGNVHDQLDYVPDSVGWSKELDIFRQLESMNKPINKTKYLVDDGLYDPGSNLTVKVFTSLEPLPVRSLRIFYDTDIQKPRKIEAVFIEENSLYESAKNLLLEFQQINNKNLLTNYSIDGGQKMILSDSVTFSVKGKIKF